MQILRTPFVSTMLITTAVPASAQDRSVDVRFPACATGTTISDSVTDRDTVFYKLGVEAGQTMNVVLSSNNTATYFNVCAPGSWFGDAALLIGEFTDPINASSSTLGPGPIDFRRAG